MAKAPVADDKLKKNRNQFDLELKMFVNQKLYEKRIITEEMYHATKELLLRQAV